MEINEKETLKRGEFLRSLGLSTSALMAFYCMGTLTACSSGDDDPQPGGNNNGGTGSTAGLTGKATGSSIDFTLDLTNSNYNKLKTEGQFVIAGDVIVALASGNKYVALSKRCTHEGTNVQYRLAQNDMYCSNHMSAFNLDGTVKQSPAASPLKVYKTELSQNGNSLRVYE
ncbi:ubiquinol-cytochrome c reductase iron-sulfur subunit [Telluribacter sp. SYSU D00476]|uniref:QcrA and Rieske domain-containing protein n=1 Tax=Telluribacter sp. SYSU D00476 TaxID=2811430 RepID=UPI001FF15E85|nr:Rieske (2Fe-2S) protein [Telluribacter sp. SYSU D00476]